MTTATIAPHPTEDALRLAWSTAADGDTAPLWTLTWELIRQHMPMARRQAITSGLPAHMAADLSPGDLVETVLSRAAGWDPDRSDLRARLLHLARQAGHEQGRNYSRSQRRQAPLRHHCTVAADKCETCSRLADRSSSASELVDDLIDCLDDLDRQLVVDRYITRMTLTEISELYALPVSACKRRIESALDACRQRQPVAVG